MVHSWSWLGADALRDIGLINKWLFTMPTDIQNTFSQLSKLDKALVLARLIHERTIEARDAYAHSAPDGAQLMKCNESMHQLAGFLLTMLSAGGQQEFIADAIERIACGSPIRRAQLERWLSEIKREGD
jgi:hypothetical protein